MSSPRHSGSDLSDHPPNQLAAQRRLVLVNQFIPPALPPTARLLGELMQATRQAGWQTVALGRTRGYGSKAVGGWRRYLRDLAAHARIGWALFWVRRPSLIVCLSDPPCLPVTVAIIARLRRIPVIHWAMDIYPETALALGQLRPGRLSHLLNKAMAWAYRQCLQCVALDEDMATHIRKIARQPPLIDVLPPWPPAISTITEPLQTKQKTNEFTWLYSGNLGRAHDWSTIIETQHQLEQLAEQDPHAPVWHLVLQGGGAAMANARTETERLGLRRVEFRPYVADAELLPSLLAADVLIATLKPELRGLLWPSKLALMCLCDRPIAWIGPVEGAIVRYLAAQAKTGVFEPGDTKALADWLNSLVRSATLRDRGKSVTAVVAEVDQIRRTSLENWLHRLLQT